MFSIWQLPHTGAASVATQKSQYKLAEIFPGFWIQNIKGTSILNCESLSLGTSFISKIHPRKMARVWSTKGHSRDDILSCQFI